MPLLQNNIIALRALEPEDLDLFYVWENNAEYWQYGNTLAPYSRFAIKQYLLNAQRDIYENKELRLMVERKVDKKAIGAVDLFNYDPYHQRAELGILIDKTFQQQGFSSMAMALVKEYAFDFLGLKQLYCHVPQKNEPCKRMVEKAGFVAVGIKKAWLKTPFGFDDVVFYQLVKQ